VVLSAYPRGSAVKEKTRPLLSFVPPSAGMFVWVQLYFGDVPDKTDEEDGSVITPERQFWYRLIDAGVLIAPGWIFSPSPAEAVALPGGADRQFGHMRLSYTPPDVSGSFSRTVRSCLLTGAAPFRSPQMETTRRGVNIFAQTLREFCRV
jgi:DNA-binding transcriptional MocR family regulator